MNTYSDVLDRLEKNGFKVSTDTRTDVLETVYFALSGDNFNGNKFVTDALAKGAYCAITDDQKNIGENIVYVDNVLKALQHCALVYRQKFSIPMLCIGGSNGKSTSKELIRAVLQRKYKVHATIGSLNNHIGLPLSILSMPRDTEIGVFEIGANHPHEHTSLLNILEPTHVVVTNNGMDHLEGFGTPEGSRRANKEIYDWAHIHTATAFVNKNHMDLLEDSSDLERNIYSHNTIGAHSQNLIGSYNDENIDLAVAVGIHFDVSKEKIIEGINLYEPLSKRSQLLTENGIDFIVDCYNANPTSMLLALRSFVLLEKNPKGVILGDMLELGTYTDQEHIKIVNFVEGQKFDCIIYIGHHFKKALAQSSTYTQWFATSEEAKDWFIKQNFQGYTFLLKGSRGIAVEKIL
jgi:UDP-N-acetylmuramoyl-tripeptide--D-alanyl-D-alanine ligase